MSTTFDDLLTEATEEITNASIFDDNAIENIEIETINAETVVGKSGTGSK